MQRIGRYEVVRSLGKGGMGQVYLARDPKLDRELALKLLQHEDDPDARALFEREAKALAALNHPNIVTIYEIAEADERQFIAMEYLPGRSLRDLLLHDKPSRDTLLSIHAQVGGALSAAHAAGILHRDIKPENVVVGNNVKVVDFGIARRLDTPSLDPSTARRDAASSRSHADRIVDVFTRTVRVNAIETAPGTRGNSAVAVDTEPAGRLTSATKTVFGTPAYMAPEVLMGEPSSPASDVYSLGVMLYECLSGRRPHDAPNLHEVIARAIDGDPPEQLDDPLGPLIARMLDRVPSQRPSLEEVGRALTRRRSTIAAPPPPRRRGIAIAGAIAVVLALAGIAVAWKLRSNPTPPAPVAAPAPIDRGPTAFGDFATDLPSYGIPADGETFGRVLALLLRKNGLLTVEPNTLRGRGTLGSADDWLDAAARHGAKLLVRGSVTERRGKAHAEIEVIEVASRRQLASHTLAGEPDQIGVLLRDTASWLAGTLRPGTTLDRADNPTLAEDLVAQGIEELSALRGSRARTLFEQATVVSPTSFEAWDRYAASLAQSAAKRELVLTAAREAHRLAPPGPRKRILRGNELRYQLRFADALAEVEQLDLDQLQGDDLRDALFVIGEGHWHEGRHELGFSYFRRVLELDSRFGEAVSHASEYGLARRLEGIAREYVGMQHQELAAVDFAMGRYDKVAAGDRQPYRAWAQQVLGRPIDPAPVLDARHQTYERLADAAAARDLVAVDKEVDLLLEQAEPFTTFAGILLAGVAEATIAAELAGPSAKILARLRDKQPGYHYHRLSILAAPMLGAPKFPRGELTERLAHLTLAIEAELAGDRETAVKGLRALVDNPTYEWEFVERAALLRNLRALGRTADAAALCADTLRPTVMRYVFRVVRRLCRR